MNNNISVIDILKDQGADALVLPLLDYARVEMSVDSEEDYRSLPFKEQWYLCTDYSDTSEGYKVQWEVASNLGLTAEELQENLAHAALPYMLPFLAEHSTVVIL